jgi:hypothetical protein
MKIFIAGGTGAIGRPAIRLYPETLEIFQSLPRGIDGRLFLLLAPHELSTFLPYMSDTRRKK